MRRILINAGQEKVQLVNEPRLTLTNIANTLSEPPRNPSRAVQQSLDESLGEDDRARPPSTLFIFPRYENGRSTLTKEIAIKYLAAPLSVVSTVQAPGDYGTVIQTSYFISRDAVSVQSVEHYGSECIPAKW